MWIRIRAVIIEDEPLAAQYLAALLDDTCQIEVVGSATESEAGLRLRFTGKASELLPVKDVDRDQIRLLARREVAAVLRQERRTLVHTVREEFATYYPLADLMRWLGGDPFIQIGRHAAVNLHAIEHVTHYGDRLYRVRLRDRAATEIMASRTGAARLASVLKTQC
jgi:DNA-binding LytR/AlgR family response regulator